jgi:TonB family protein
VSTGLDQTLKIFAKVTDMRSLFLCLLTAFLGSTNVFADEATFKHTIFAHIHGHPPPYPVELANATDEVSLTLTCSIDRDGKVVQAEVTKGSGSAKADQDILAWFRNLEPFPAIPADLPAPFKISQELVLVPPSLATDLGIKWVANARSSPSEPSFRDQMAVHLKHHPRSYSGKIKTRRGSAREIVTLLIDQSGFLLQAPQATRLGSNLPDEETIDWLVAIQPFPKIPADMKSPLTLTAEITFGPPKKPASNGLWDDERIKKSINNVCRGC